MSLVYVGTIYDPNLQLGLVIVGEMRGGYIWYQRNLVPLPRDMRIL